MNAAVMDFSPETSAWTTICPVDHILPNTGVCALVEGRHVAVFRVGSGQLFAIDNVDPKSGASVLSRGLVGSLGGRTVVASPLYKQHYDLRTGECLESPEYAVQAHPMAYLAPSEFVTKMVDAGESKLLMSTKDTLIRAYMAGAILALAAAFAVTVTVNTGNPLIGALLFPVGFCILYLLGFDLLTGVFTLAPLAVMDKRPGATWGGVMRNWTLVFFGNFAGALTVAVFMAIIFTNGFTEAPNAIGQKIGHIGEGPHGGLCGPRRRRHADAVHPCGDVQLDGLHRRGRGHDVHQRVRQGHRHVDADPGVLLHGLRAQHRQHVPVPLGPDAGRQVHLHGLPDLERDPHGAGQPGGRPDLRRRHAVLHALQDRRPSAWPDATRASRQALSGCHDRTHDGTLHVDARPALRGGRKPLNQDFHGAVVPKACPAGTKGVALALADGISSSPVSQVASAAAVRGFLEDYYLTSEAWPVRRAAQRVLQATNSWLHAQTSAAMPASTRDRGYVCTFSALVSRAARRTCCMWATPASTGCTPTRWSS
jgi:NAD(P)H-dependent nitrite reductase small subunit